MKKIILVLNAQTVKERLAKGLKVKGVLYRDQDTDMLTFCAYNCSYQKKDHLIEKLEFGWVKESATRIKVYDSVPKELGTRKVIDILNREHQAAKEAVIERELDIIEFC